MAIKFTSKPCPTEGCKGIMPCGVTQARPDTVELHWQCPKCGRCEGESVVLEAAPVASVPTEDSDGPTE